MQKWMKKTLMITVAFLTLGLITPQHEIWEAFDDSRLENIAVQSIQQVQAVPLLEQQSVLSPEEVRDTLITAAKEQSYVKFGERIAPKISNEFEMMIFPKMQEAIDMTIARLDVDTVRSLVISEKPSGDYSEKIFHIANANTREDIIRFHVRTENRPQQGYFYNFHYHTMEDAFVTHYNLGEIYWNRNTPPKWLS